MARRGDVEAFAESYLRIRILAAIPVLIARVGHGWLRGAHDTVTAMVIAVSGAAANIVLGYLLIFPAGFGIEGAAWAVVICQSGAAARFVVTLLRRMTGTSWRWDAPTARSLLRVGAALAIRTGSLLAALTVATSVAARMGEIEVASWQITMQLFLFLALTLDAIAIAAQAIIGRALGSTSPTRAIGNSARLMQWGIGLGVVLMVALLPFARMLAGVFTDDPQVVDAAGPLIVWLALLQPLAGARVHPRRQSSSEARTPPFSQLRWSRRRFCSWEWPSRPFSSSGAPPVWRWASRCGWGPGPRPPESGSSGGGGSDRWRRRRS